MGLRQKAKKGGGQTVKEGKTALLIQSMNLVRAFRETPLQQW
jgi:hypothetical protein